MKTNATIALFGMALPLVAGAQESVSQKQEALEKTLEGILSKAGLTVSGRATGEFLNSELSGTNLRDTVRSAEPVSYTQVDFTLRARPNTGTTVKAVFRMHLDWPNFFGAPYTPFETRWLSIDGKAVDMLYYSVGDMSLKWSPYTIQGNDVGFLYTPRMFAQMQEQAMGERFLGDNVRNLQGAQLGLRAAVPAIMIDSFNIGTVVGKLANATNNLADNPPPALPYDWSDFDRWVLGGRGEITALKGLSLGASYLSFMDLKGTHANQGTSRAAGIDRNTAETGDVLGGRLGVQVDKFVEMPVKVGLQADFSQSSWEYQGLNLNTGAFGADKMVEEVLTADTLFSRRKIDGLAFAADLKLGYALEQMLDGKLSVGFMQNDSGYRNDLVQSATFSAQRILNTVQDGGFSNYSTFDALYHNVHRFVPEVRTNEMSKNPMEKVAYTNQVGAGTPRRSDDILQTVLPGAAATANRTGPRFGLDVGVLDGAVTLVANGWILSTVKAVPLSTRRVVVDSATGATDASFETDSMVVVPVTRTVGAVVDTIYNLQKTYKVDYQKIQAGAKIRAEKFLGDMWTLPIELSGSYELNSMKSGSVRDFKANIINAGLYLGVWKRTAITAGYQLANTEDKILSRRSDATAWTGSKYTTKQQHVGAGLEYKVTEGSYVSFAWSQIQVEYPEEKFLEKPTDKVAVARDFTQDILNAKLTVGF
jgi:hypothetical protein